MPTIIFYHASARPLTFNELKLQLGATPQPKTWKNGSLSK